MLRILPTFQNCPRAHQLTVLSPSLPTRSHSPLVPHSLHSPPPCLRCRHVAPSSPPCLRRRHWICIRRRLISPARLQFLPCRIVRRQSIAARALRLCPFSEVQARSPVVGFSLPTVDLALRAGKGRIAKDYKEQSTMRCDACKKTAVLTSLTMQKDKSFFFVGHPQHLPLHQATSLSPPAQTGLWRGGGSSATKQRGGGVRLLSRDDAQPWGSCNPRSTGAHQLHHDWDQCPLLLLPCSYHFGLLPLLEHGVGPAALYK